MLAHLPSGPVKLPYTRREAMQFLSHLTSWHCFYRICIICHIMMQNKTKADLLPALHAHGSDKDVLDVFRDNTNSENIYFRYWHSQLPLVFFTSRGLH